MKWILIIILIVIIMLIANSVSEQYKEKLDFYNNLKNFLYQFKLNLNFKQEKIIDFLDKTNGKKQFNQFINAYKKYLSTNKFLLDEIKILDTEEKKQLTDIVISIGKMDAKNESKQIELFLIDVETKQKSAENDKNKLCPMILKLSLLFAIGVAILLI